LLIAVGAIFLVSWVRVEVGAGVLYMHVFDMHVLRYIVVGICLFGIVIFCFY